MAHKAKDADLAGPSRRPIGLLLDAATQIPDAEISDERDGRLVPRWPLAGIEYLPWGTSNLSTGPVGCDVVDNKTPVSYESLVTQLAFLIWDGIKCSALSGTAAQLDERLATNLDVYVSAAFGSELMTGAASGGTAFDSAVPSPSATARSLRLGFADLEDLLAENLHGAVGMIHVPPSVLALADTLVVRDGDVWRTRSGHVVVADAGYTGQSPDGHSTAADERFIYASSPVQWAITETRAVGDRNQESTDMTRNEFQFLAERYGLVAFDPNAVWAVKVTLA